MILESGHFLFIQESFVDLTTSFPYLVTLNVFLEVTLYVSKFNLVVQLGALFFCVVNVFVVGVVHNPVHVLPIS